MDIKQLEFFVTACERGSLSQAAICLYTSQPNVSKTIRSLERELGKGRCLNAAEKAFLQRFMEKPFWNMQK